MALTVDYFTKEIVLACVAGVFFGVFLICAW